MANLFDQSDIDSKFSEDDFQVEELTPEQKEDSEAYTTRCKSDDSFVKRSVCAYISYHGSCGFANSGNISYAVNRRSDRSVTATILKSWQGDGRSGTQNQVVNIPPGGRIRLGCTRGSYVSGGIASFSVIGCQVR